MNPQQREELEKKIKGILKDGQYKRYRELTYQFQGPQAIGDTKVAIEVGLTLEQHDKIREILESNRPQQMGGPGGQGRPGQGQGGAAGGQGGQRQGGGFGAPPGGPGQGMSPEDMQKMQKQMEAQKEKVGKLILDVLNEKQRDKWESMNGKAFKFKGPQQGGRPGGPGGPGGPPPNGGGRGGGGN
jgi:hypothetical protein